MTDPKTNQPTDPVGPVRWKELEELLPQANRGRLAAEPTLFADPPPAGTEYSYFEHDDNRFAWTDPVPGRPVPIAVFDLEGDADGGWMLSNLEWLEVEEAGRRRAGHRYATSHGWSLEGGEFPRLRVWTSKQTTLMGDGLTERFTLRGPFRSGSVRAVGPTGPLTLLEIPETSEIEFDSPPAVGAQIKVEFQVDS